jgi:hypothetical protein
MLIFFLELRILLSNKWRDRVICPVCVRINCFMKLSEVNLEYINYLAAYAPHLF